MPVERCLRGSITGSIVVLLATLWGAPARAEPFVCTSILPSGTYDAVLVPTGARCELEHSADVTVSGNVEIEPNDDPMTNRGLILHGPSGSLTVGRNVIVGPGSVLFSTVHTSIHGNLVIRENADVRNTLSTNVLEIWGNVSATGARVIEFRSDDARVWVGGSVDLQEVEHASLMKVGEGDLVIEGTVTVEDSSLVLIRGAAIGRALTVRGATFFVAIDSNTTGGSMTVIDNHPSSLATWIISNTIGRTLACHGNDPPPLLESPLREGNVARNFEGQCVPDD
jgi:hypothetical protein